MGPSVHLPNWTAITKTAKNGVVTFYFDTFTVVELKTTSQSHTRLTRISEQVFECRQPVFAETHDLIEVPQLAR